MKFKLHSKFKPAGGQPKAIKQLIEGYSKFPIQTLQGITGSGKTFVMANVIENIQKPTLVLAHNKTLAAQLYQELKEFFPENKVEYFISYYDYYQPESYIPTSDTYIDKEATVNEEIEKMRLRTISSLMSRNDVIVVASISCIYGAGNPEDFKAMSFEIKVGDEISRTEILNKFVEMQYSRNDVDLDSGNFRVRGDVIDISPPYIDEVIRIEMFGDEIENIFVLDKVTGERKDSSKLINNIEEDEKLKFSEDILEKEKIRFTPSKGELDKIRIFPSKQFVVEEEKMENAIEQIKAELKQRAQELNLVEEQRLRQRVKYDLEMMQEVGYCTGIENYSRYFDNRKPGTPPHVLLDYFGDDFLFIIDESHQTLPQAHAMYKGDYSRKKNLIDFGFRLPSAFDNRPLKFEEFEKYFNHTIFVSATPADYELEHSGQMVEQIIRPTGLLDPIIEVRKSTGQVKNLLEEIRETVKNGDRVLVTTLTKRMAEDLTDYFSKEQIKVRYMHSDIDSLDRIELVRQLRAGEFDVLVGINLLREGLDIPEVSLVAILDADKEGFLRNERSLIQTIGRAARNSEGRVIMYADKETMSMKKAIEITKYRRQVQEKFNIENGIEPKTILKKVEEKTREIKSKKHISKTDLQKEILTVESDMKKAAEGLDFELAIKLRDRLEELKREI